MQLEQTIGWIRESLKEGDITPSPSELACRWQQAWNTLGDRITNLYLIEYIFAGDIVIRSEPVAMPFYDVKDFKSFILYLRVQGQWIRLCPNLNRYSEFAGTITLRGEDPRVESILLCDMRQPDSKWLIQTREQGLRRILNRILPAHYKLLNEARFKDALSHVLMGYQPILNWDYDTLSTKAKEALDRLTSVEASAVVAWTSAQIVLLNAMCRPIAEWMSGTIPMLRGPGRNLRSIWRQRPLPRIRWR